MGASTFMRKTSIAIINMRAIIPTMIDPIVPAKPKLSSQNIICILGY